MTITFRVMPCNRLLACAGIGLVICIIYYQHNKKGRIAMPIQLNEIHPSEQVKINLFECGSVTKRSISMPLRCSLLAKR